MSWVFRVRQFAAAGLAVMGALVLAGCFGLGPMREFPPEFFELRRRLKGSLFSWAEMSALFCVLGALLAYPWEREGED